MIARGAAVHGDAPAVLHGDRAVSFREFQRRVDTLAAGLAQLGIQKGDRICILAQNDPGYLDLYGACASGATVTAVPARTAYGSARTPSAGSRTRNAATTPRPPAA